MGHDSQNHLIRVTGLVATLIATGVLTGCGATDIPTGPNKIRTTAVKQAALSYGAQNGLAWRAKQITKTLSKYTYTVNRIFNFNALLLTHNLLPPILVEDRNSLSLTDPNTIRLADRTYKIERVARFTTTPPSWRDYIVLKYPQPHTPNTTLLPKNSEEREIWDANVNVGWQEGIYQAEDMFQMNLYRMQRDYVGMVLYHTLLAQNMISQPYVSKAALGITGDAREMRINDQVIRITEHSNLRPGEAKRWVPALQNTDK